MNWKPGEDVLIAGSVNNEDAKKLFGAWKAPKPYIRIVPQPNEGESAIAATTPSRVTSTTHTADRMAEIPTGRPRRADVTVSYDLGVERYDQLWSPVILPAATALLPWLRLAENSVVLDVGTGTGALVPAIRDAAPGVSVVGVDASLQMLRVAHSLRGVRAVRADAMELPVAAESIDAVAMAYVLFHLADPRIALEDAWRVLRPGGRVATVTWASERPEGAQQRWDQAFADANLPALPVRRSDTGLDSVEAVSDLLRAAGYAPSQVWSYRLSHQWDPQSFFDLASGAGTSRQRLAAVPPDARAALLARLRDDLGQLGPEEFWWEGQVICAVATKEQT